MSSGKAQRPFLRPEPAGRQTISRDGGVTLVVSGRNQMAVSEELVRYVQPPWVPTSVVPTRPEADFLEPLGELLERDDQAPLRRLWLALESYFYALIDNEMSRGLWRLVHLNIAFEALLDFDSGRQFVRRVGKIMRALLS